MARNDNFFQKLSKNGNGNGNGESNGESNGKGNRKGNGNRKGEYGSFAALRMTAV